MNEQAEILINGLKHHQKAVLARVIKTWGSSPRPIGSIMLIDEAGKLSGSVSGGCVEGDVAKKAMDVLKGEQSLRLHYGVSDEDAWSVGLSCGGSIQVFLQPIALNQSPVWGALLESLNANKSAILISALDDGENVNALIKEDGKVVGDTVPETLIKEANTAYSKRSHSAVTLDDKEYFIQVFPRKPQLLIIGAAHITVDLIALANQFGFETIVIDPRGYFTKNTTFTYAPDQLLESYPSEVLNNFALDAYTFSAILSHDPKIDDNALEILLPSEVAYIGALGSKKTHAKRTARLLEKGISQEMIDRIKAPIGVSINARSAKEIALAIMAQVIAAKNQYLLR